MSKSKRENPFSRKLTSAIAKYVPEDGSSVTREELAEKLSKAFTVSHPEMLKVVIGLAVQSGAVPGCSSQRGRNGGVFRTSAREAAEATPAQA